MAAVIDRLEDALVGLIDGLGLTLPDLTAVTVKRQKDAAIREGLDAAPLVTVSAAPVPGKDAWWDTGTAAFPNGRKQRQYSCLVNFAAAGNRTQLADDGTYQLWRERTMGCVEPLSVWDVAELYDVMIQPGPWVDAGNHVRNLDTSKLTLTLVTIESASN